VSRGSAEARGWTVLVAMVCALAVAASVSPDVAHILDLVFAWLFGLGAVALVIGGLWWWLSGLSGSEPAQARSTPPESHAEPIDAVVEGDRAGGESL